MSKKYYLPIPANSKQGENIISKSMLKGVTNKKQGRSNKQTLLRPTSPTRSQLKPVYSNNDVPMCPNYIRIYSESQNYISQYVSDHLKVSSEPILYKAINILLRVV